MIPLLAVGLLLGVVPGEHEGDVEEPVSFLLTGDVGALPRLSLELEAPINANGSAFVSLGYPITVGFTSTVRIPGPRVAAGWRVFLFGRGPWGLFADGRLMADVYFPTDPQAPSPVVVPGGGFTLGLNVKLWHVVISPGLSLFYLPDPANVSPLVPALRLGVGGWN